MYFGAVLSYNISVNIDDFIEKLAEYKNTDTIFNMYHGNSASAKKCRENLKKYLEEHKDAQILLVGEAPGYKGCARTGVPFTSDDNEMSAKVVQKAIGEKDVMMWNTFPFHPHKKGNKKTNRTPNTKELFLGEVIFADFLQTFPKAKCFGAVGRVAKNALKRSGYGCLYIRHPAHGGKKECEKGIQELFQRYERMKKAGFLDWPSYISDDESVKYINKIKLDYIRRATCEGNDLYYEHARSEWFMTLNLRVNDNFTHVFIWGYDAYKKIEDMIIESGEFAVNDERPMQLRRYTYIRK